MVRYELCKTAASLVEALQALTRLRDRNLVDQGQVALFYTELTDIMRRYAGRRFEVPYLERTTGEILRDYGVGAQILLDLGITDMILLSNTQRTIVGLEGFGLRVVETRSLSVEDQ